MLIVMNSIWNYFYTNPQPNEVDTPLIKFGKWDSQLDYIDYNYHEIITKLIRFAQEAGKDKYDRYFNAECLLDFAITSKITDKSADYIYRHYVYHLLSMHEEIDIDEEEMKNVINEFEYID